jgi:glucosamine kinase
MIPAEGPTRLNHVIAIDGGGTHCRALLADRDGRMLGRADAGAANIMTDMDGACRNIVEAAEGACAAAGVPSAAISSADAFLGLAGANIGRYGERIRSLLPFRRAVVDTDALVALQGALGDGDGAVAIIGTGSVFMARSGSTIRSVGGWGFMVGDLGSGARVGRALLQEALLAHDGVHRGSDLTREVLRRFEDDPQTLVEYAHTARPGEFGTFTPLVFEYAERSDPIANALIEGAVRSIGEALDAIMPSGCDRLCLLGGLARRYESRLRPDHRRIVREPLGNGLEGALALALSHFGSRRESRHG